MKYFSINLYRKLLNCAIQEGLSERDFDQFAIPIAKLDDLAVIDAEEYLAVHEHLDKILEPGFAIRVGQQMKLEDYGVLGLSWKTCSWVGEIFERSKRYFRLLSNTFIWDIKDEGAYADVHLIRNPHRRGMELSTEASLSATIVVMEALAEKKVTPVQVSFKHSAPSNLASYHQAFNCPILFNQPHYSIRFESAQLKQATAKADASINRYLLKQVDEKTKGIKIAGNAFIRDVEELIADGLATGIPSVESTSKLLAMSSRTFTRRLAEAGVTYRDLIRKKQETIAKALLEDPSKSIGDIAYLTGFSEQSAFNRAFKRWTGSSPSDFRKQQ